MKYTSFCLKKKEKNFLHFQPSRWGSSAHIHGDFSGMIQGSVLKNRTKFHSSVVSRQKMPLYCIWRYEQNRLVQLFIAPYSSISEIEARLLGVWVPCGANLKRKNSVIHHFLKMEGLFRKKFQMKVIPRLIPHRKCSYNYVQHGKRNP